MKMNKVLTTAAACALFLCGCGLKDNSITSENAPTEMLKTIASLNSDSDPETVLATFESMVNATAKAYDYKLELRPDNETKAPVLGAGTGLSESTTTSSQFDVRYATAENVYELLEQQSNGQEIMGLMDAGGSSTTTVYANFVEGGFRRDPSTALIESVDVKENEDAISGEQLTDSIQNMVVYPIWPLLGANLILQPFAQPEYYDFNLSQDGTSYTLNITMKDQDAYNDALDKFVSEYYGYERTDLNGNGSVVLDSYVTTGVDISITMDENGVISRITNNNYNDLTLDDDTITAYIKQTAHISGASDGYGTFFEDFFGKLNKEELAQGDEFTIELPEAKSEEDTAKDDAAKDDASKEEAKDDAAKDERPDETPSKDQQEDETAGNVTTDDAKADDTK